MIYIVVQKSWKDNGHVREKEGIQKISKKLFPDTEPKQVQAFPDAFNPVDDIIFMPSVILSDDNNGEIDIIAISRYIIYIIELKDWGYRKIESKGDPLQLSCTNDFGKIEYQENPRFKLIQKYKEIQRKFNELEDFKDFRKDVNFKTMLIFTHNNVSELNFNKDLNLVFKIGDSAFNTSLFLDSQYIGTHILGEKCEPQKKNIVKRLTETIRKYFSKEILAQDPNDLGEYMVQGNKLFNDEEFGMTDYLCIGKEDKKVYMARYSTRLAVETDPIKIEKTLRDEKCLKMIEPLKKDPFRHPIYGDTWVNIFEWSENGTLSDYINNKNIMKSSNEIVIILVSIAKEIKKIQKNKIIVGSLSSKDILITKEDPPQAKIIRLHKAKIPEAQTIFNEKDKAKRESNSIAEDWNVLYKKIFTETLTKFKGQINDIEIPDIKKDLENIFVNDNVGVEKIAENILKKLNMLHNRLFIQQNNPVSIEEVIDINSESLTKSIEDQHYQKVEFESSKTSEKAWLFKANKQTNTYLIKVFKNEENFLNEISVLDIKHSNILPILDSGTIMGLNYIKTNFIDGELLKDIHFKQFDDFFNFTDQMISALKKLHENGIFHLDINPSNIIMEKKTGRYILFDFDVAVKKCEDNVHKFASFRGTPGYISHEFYSEKIELKEISIELIDDTFDIFGLGSILFEKITSKTPNDNINSSLSQEIDVALFDNILIDSLSEYKEKKKQNVKSSNVFYKFNQLFKEFIEKSIAKQNRHNDQSFEEGFGKLRKGWFDVKKIADTPDFLFRFPPGKREGLEIEKQLKDSHIIEKNESIQIFSEKGYQDFYNGWLVRFQKHHSEKIELMILEPFDDKKEVKILEVDYMSIRDKKLKEPQVLYFDQNNQIKALGVLKYIDTEEVKIVLFNGSKMIDLIFQDNQTELIDIESLPVDGIKFNPFRYESHYDWQEVSVYNLTEAVKIEITPVYGKFYHPTIQFGDDYFDIDCDSVEKDNISSLVVNDSVLSNDECNENIYHVFWSDGKTVWYKKVKTIGDKVVDAIEVIYE